MSTVEITKRLAEGSPRVKSGLVLAYYLLSIVTGGVFFFTHGRLAFAADLVAAVLYLAVTAFVYSLSARRDRDKKVERV